MSDEYNNSDPNNGDQEGRPIRNIKGLLKFCVEATKREDAEGTRDNPEPMSEERRKWLEEALTSMTVSPAERLIACQALIEGAEPDTAEGTEQQTQALTELEEWVEDLDIAQDFVKLNGLRVVPKLLSSEVSELRWRCLEVLANLSQNNPMTQNAILSLKLLPVMLHMVDADPNPTVRIKALYAVSCLIRGSPEAERELLKCQGLGTVVGCLSCNEEKLKLKAAFLISNLCGSNPAFKDSLTDQGAVEQLVSQLRESEHSPTHEHLMSALLSIVIGNHRAREKCLDVTLDLKTFLCQRLRHLEGKEQFQEESEYANQLLALLNQNPEPFGETSSSSTSSTALMIA